MRLQRKQQQQQPQIKGHDCTSSSRCTQPQATGTDPLDSTAQLTSSCCTSSSSSVRLNAQTAADVPPTLLLPLSGGAAAAAVNAQAALLPVPGWDGLFLPRPCCCCCCLRLSKLAAVEGRESVLSIWLLGRCGLRPAADSTLHTSSSSKAKPHVTTRQLRLGMHAAGEPGPWQ